jgi:hypothetical protein
MTSEKPKINYHAAPEPMRRRGERPIPLIVLAALVIFALLAVWLHFHDRRFWDM